MELVYLWVEEYECLKEDTFIFDKSYKNKFGVNIDDMRIIVTELTNENALTKLPQNFYGNDINISSICGIVGINGSGKTTLLKFIFEKLTYLDNNNLNFFGVFRIKNRNGQYEVIKFKKESSKIIEFTDAQSLAELFKTEELQVAYFSNVFDGEYFRTEFIDNKHFDLSTNKLLHQNKSLAAYKVDQVQKDILFLATKNADVLKGIDFKFPQSLSLQIRFNSEEILNTGFDEIIKGLEDSFDKIPVGTLDVKLLIDFSILSGICLSPNFPRALGFTPDTFKFNPLISTQSFNKFWDSSGFDDKNLLPSLDIGLYVKVNLFRKKIFEFIDENKKYFKVDFSDQNPFKIFEKSDFNKYAKKNETNIHGIPFNNLELLNDLVLDYKSLVSFAQFDFLEMNWWGLSSGEIAMLNLFSRLYNKFYVDNDIPSGNVLIMIDEADVYLHTARQQGFIKNIISGINHALPNSNIQLLISTHSPILLSDIPQSHVLYLKDKDPEIATFGANIHTLYKCSFFLTNSLMGHFSKEKIENLIEFLNHNKNNDSYYDDFSKESSQTLIDIIGEPFIQTKIQDLYNNKYGVDEEVEKLEKRLTILKQRNS